MSYEEAMIGAVRLSYGTGLDHLLPDAKETVALIATSKHPSITAIRAALARGPQGKAEPERERVWYRDWQRACERASTAEAARDEWKARALAAETEWAAEKRRFLEEKHRLGVAESKLRAAEAKVKELEARLTDAALVEAGWVPMDVAQESIINGHTSARFHNNLWAWRSARAQQAKGGS